MKILILNGSPRFNGNTNYALRTIAEGFEKNTKHEVEIIDVAKLKISGCVACETCKSNGGNCTMPDSSKSLIDKIYASDAVIFGTPVYWWGMSSQLKAVVDKFYSKTAQFKVQNKQVGVVAIGTCAVSNDQYGLIHDQFRCITGFLGWDLKFNFSYSASAPNDLQKSESAARELSEAWKML